jgi:hypothetical protein
MSIREIYLILKCVMISCLFLMIHSNCAQMASTEAQQDGKITRLQEEVMIRIMKTYSFYFIFSLLVFLPFFFFSKNLTVS